MPSARKRKRKRKKKENPLQMTKVPAESLFLHPGGSPHRRTLSSPADLISLSRTVSLGHRTLVPGWEQPWGVACCAQASFACYSIVYLAVACRLWPALHFYLQLLTLFFLSVFLCAHTCLSVGARACLSVCTEARAPCSVTLCLFL